jgi:hypothetical protein
MEEFPGSVPDAKPNENQDKKKKQRKGASFRVPNLVSLEGTDKVKSTTEHEAPSITDILAGEVHKQNKDIDDTATEPVTSEDNTQQEQLTESDNLHVVESKSETDDLDETETYEPLKGYEAEPVEFSGGEVIIHLSGDRPINERVVMPSNETFVTSEIPVTATAQSEAPVFIPQLEQQQYGHESASSEIPSREAIGGGDIPPVPPRNRPTASSEGSPEPHPIVYESIFPRSEDIYERSDVLPSPRNQASVVEQGATKKDVEKAVYYAAKAGQNRGLLTGLLVFGGYEHFKHKRRERRQEKRFQKQAKQLETVGQDLDFNQREQAQTRGEANRRFASVEKRLNNVVNLDKLVHKKPATGDAQGIEQLDIPPDHRLESSAWHTIEVDSRTGKPVENPTFQYGHEYYRERAQEGTPTAQRNAAAGEVALVAVAAEETTKSTTDTNAATQSGRIPDATTQGPPIIGSQAEANTKQKSAQKQSSTTGPLWPWLVALVVIVICLVAVVR